MERVSGPGGPEPTDDPAKFDSGPCEPENAASTGWARERERLERRPATKPRKPRRKGPSVATMERWLDAGGAKATDGCWVEPDGTCEHGKRSWLLVLGLI